MNAEYLTGQPRELNFYGEGKADSIDQGFAIVSLRNPRPDYAFVPREQILANCKDDHKKIPVVVIANGTRMLRTFPDEVLALDGCFSADEAAEMLRSGGYPGYENTTRDSKLQAIAFISKDAFDALTPFQQKLLITKDFEDFYKTMSMPAFRHIFLPTIAHWIAQRGETAIDWVKFLERNGLLGPEMNTERYRTNRYYSDGKSILDDFPAFRDAYEQIVANPNVNIETLREIFTTDIEIPFNRRFTALIADDPRYWKEYTPGQAQALVNAELRYHVPQIATVAQQLNTPDVLAEISDMLAQEGTRFTSLGFREAVRELASAIMYPKVGETVSVSEHDFLVTTPLAKAHEHVGEAEELIAAYRENPDNIGWYYRNFNPYAAPKALGIGSKIFYVDQRAIRGFAVVTGFSVNPSTHDLMAQMLADTWRWIEPIPCDYNVIKPPQAYAHAKTHTYFQGVDSVKIIGGWLDPMPK